MTRSSKAFDLLFDLASSLIWPFSQGTLLSPCPVNSDTVYLFSDLLPWYLMEHVLNIGSFTSNGIPPSLMRRKAAIVKEMKNLSMSIFMPV